MSATKPEDSPRWPFADPPNLAVITTDDILKRGFPVVRVTHDEDDGSRQFHSERGAPEDLTEGHVVALRTIVAMDATIAELADLRVGWCATRGGPGGEWRRGPK